MATVDQLMQQAIVADEEAIWDEIVGALTSGTELHEAAFAQLQGSEQPFKDAIAIAAALPERIRQRSQRVLRSWAAREAKELKVQRAASEIALQQQRAQLDHDLAIVGFTPQRRAPALQQAPAGTSSGIGMRRALALTAASSASDSSSTPVPVTSETSPQDPSPTPRKLKSKKARSKSVGAPGKSRKRHAVASASEDTVIPCKYAGPEGEGCARDGSLMTKGLCYLHGGQKKCTHPSGCTKRAVKIKLCISHGGGNKCTIEGCNKNTERKGLCGKHGGGRDCTHPSGCKRRVKRHGLCFAHGNGNLKCQFEGGGVCGKGAQKRQLCIEHGGGKECAVDGCVEPSHGNGLCYTHQATVKCAEEGGCEKLVHRKGLCFLHGGGKVCNDKSGCEKRAHKRGKCFAHGGGRKCEFEGGVCKRPVHWLGLCAKHKRLKDYAEM